MRSEERVYPLVGSKSTRARHTSRRHRGRKGSLPSQGWPCRARTSEKRVGVPDADTSTVLHRGPSERILLYGIDCSERRQAFGTKAKQYTSGLVFGKEVTVKNCGHDKYGRTICTVLLSDGTIVNHKLVSAGMCWWYRKYAPGNEALALLEREAREAKRGLWAEAEPIPPWEWRVMRKSYR